MYPTENRHSFSIKSSYSSTTIINQRKSDNNQHAAARSQSRQRQAPSDRDRDRSKTRVLLPKREKANLAASSSNLHDPKTGIPCIAVLNPLYSVLQENKSSEKKCTKQTYNKEMPSRSSLTLQCDPNEEKCIKGKRVAREAKREPSTKKARSTSGYSLKSPEQSPVPSVVEPNTIYNEIDRDNTQRKREKYQYAEAPAQKPVKRRAPEPCPTQYRRPAKSRSSLSSGNLKSEVSSVVAPNPIYPLLQNEQKKPSKFEQRRVSPQNSSYRRQKSVPEPRSARVKRQTSPASFESRNYQRPYRYPTALESSTSQLADSQNSQIMTTVVHNPLYDEMKKTKVEKKPTKNQKYIPDEKENIPPAPAYPNEVMEDICNCSCECSQTDQTQMQNAQPIRRHRSRARRQMPDNEAVTEYAASEVTVSTYGESGEEYCQARRARRRKTRRVDEFAPTVQDLCNGPSEDELPCLKSVKAQRQICANQQLTTVQSTHNSQRSIRYEQAVEEMTLTETDDVDTACDESCQCAAAGAVIVSEEDDDMPSLRPSERSSPRSLTKRTPVQTGPVEYEEKACGCSLPGSRHTQVSYAVSNRNLERSNGYQSKNVQTSATSQRSNAGKRINSSQIMTTVVPNPLYAELQSFKEDKKLSKSERFVSDEDSSPPYSTSKTSNPQSFETNEEVFCNCEQLAAIQSSKTSARLPAAQELCQQPSDDSLPRIPRLVKRGKHRSAPMPAHCSRDGSRSPAAQASSIVVPNQLYKELKQNRCCKKPVSYENVSNRSSSISTNKRYKNRAYEDSDRPCSEPCSCDASVADVRSDRLQADSFPSRSSYGLNQAQSQVSSVVVPNPLYKELRRSKQRKVLTREPTKMPRTDFSEDEVMIPQASSSFKCNALSEEICPAPCNCDPSEEEMCAPRPTDRNRLNTPQTSEYSHHNTSESLPTISSVKVSKKTNFTARVEPNRMYGEVQKNVEMQEVCKEPSNATSQKFLKSSSTNQVPNALFDELNEQCKTGRQSNRGKPSESLQLQRSRSNMGGNRQPSMISEHSELIKTTQYESPAQQGEFLSRGQPFDVPALTPLGQHNIIEELKRELIAAFAQVAPNCRKTSSAVCLCNQRKIVDMGTDPCGSSFPNSITSCHSRTPTTSIARNGLGPCSTEAMQSMASPMQSSVSRNGLGACEEIPSHCSPSYSPERRASPIANCFGESSSYGRQMIKTIPATRNGLGDCPIKRVPSPTRCCANTHSRSRSRSPRRVASPTRSCISDNIATRNPYPCNQYECLTDADYDCRPPVHDNNDCFERVASPTRRCMPDNVTTRNPCPCNQYECLTDANYDCRPPAQDNNDCGAYGSQHKAYRSNNRSPKTLPLRCVSPTNRNECFIDSDDFSTESEQSCQQPQPHPQCSGGNSGSRNVQACHSACIIDEILNPVCDDRREDDCVEESDDCCEEEEDKCRDVFVQSSFLCCCCECCCRPKPLKPLNANRSNNSMRQDDCQSDSLDNCNDAATLYQCPPNRYSSESLLTTECSECIEEASKLCRYPSPTQRSQVRINVSSKIMRPGADSDISNNSSMRSANGYDNCDCDDDDDTRQASSQYCNDDLDYSDSYCFVQDCAAQTSFSDLSSDNQDSLCFEEQNNTPPATQCLPPPKSFNSPQQPNCSNNCKCNCTCPSRCSYRKVPNAKQFLGQVAANAAAATSCKTLTYPSNCSCACKFPKVSSRNRNSSIRY